MRPVLPGTERNRQLFPKVGMRHPCSRCLSPGAGHRTSSRAPRPGRVEAWLWEPRRTRGPFGRRRRACRAHATPAVRSLSYASPPATSLVAATTRTRGHLKGSSEPRTRALDYRARLRSHQIALRELPTPVPTVLPRPRGCCLPGDVARGARSRPVLLVNSSSQGLGAPAHPSCSTLWSTEPSFVEHGRTTYVGPGQRG